MSAKPLSMWSFSVATHYGKLVGFNAIEQCGLNATVQSEPRKRRGAGCTGLKGKYGEGRCAKFLATRQALRAE